MQVAFRLPESFPQHGCILCIGNFDGVHVGHMSMLQRLSQLAKEYDLPAVILTFEPHPRDYFIKNGVLPRLSTLRDKILLIRDSECVDYVYVQNFDMAFAKMGSDLFISKILSSVFHVKHLLVGKDFRFGVGREGSLDALGLQHFKLEVMPDVMIDEKRVSSSLIRSFLADGDIIQAQRFLGHTYQITGRVKYGRQLGRTLGFPTANISCLYRCPAVSGVFVVNVRGNFGWCGGVASIGRNPTVSDNQEIKLEVYLFGFNEDLYGQCLTVHFLKKLRNEQRYDSLDELVSQINLDAEQGLAYLNSLE